MLVTSLWKDVIIIKVLHLRQRMLSEAISLPLAFICTFWTVPGG